MLRVPEVADFLISEGRRILFKPISGCELHTIALYLVGTCFAILLQQRGELVLHASAISVGGRAVLFCGASGAGKSTLAALLCRRGYGLISDDICNLKLSADDRYVVRPDGRMLKLWSNSLDFLEWRTAAQRAVRSDLDKYFVAPPGNRLAAQTVGAVYLIHDALPDEPDSIRRLRTLEGMRELRRNAYRPALVSAMDMEASYFAGSAALQVSAPRFLRSWRSWSHKMRLRSILSRWSKFRSLHRSRQLLLMEAVFWLLIAECVIRVLPFPRIARLLGTLRPPGPAQDRPNGEFAAREISWAIDRAARALPVSVVCFPRALAAWHMLHRRNIAARLHFGASRDSGSAQLRTHAWLDASGVEVTGYPEAHRCVEIGHFAR